MANYFYISKANSFDWYLVDPVFDPSYNNPPKDYDRRSYNPNGVYKQKWQTNDAPPIQISSDFTPTFKFYKCLTKIFYVDVSLPIVNNSIIGVTWKNYQATVDFSTFAIGDYYAEITYTDENDNVIIWRTSPIEIRVKHANTIKFECKNSFNKYGLFFETPNILELQFRVEGVVAYLDPESEDNLYTDQDHNITEESAIPFDLETLLIGDAAGVPEWVIGKVRLFFSLDQKRIDGEFYEKADAGAKFTPTRTQENTPNSDAYWSLNVIRNEDFILESYTVGDNPSDNEIQVIVKTKKYLLNGGNIVMANVLTDGYFLAFIQITNKDLTPFNVLVGTSAAGSELGVFPLSGDIVDTLMIGKGFRTPTTLYITGLAGFNTDVRIEYHYLDDMSVLPVGGSGGFVKNTLYWYYETTPGDFALDFDIATGLGTAGRKYEGCALIGTNGIDDISDMVLRIWDKSLPTTRQTSIGESDNLVTLSVAQLPAHHHTTDMYPGKSQPRSGGIGGQGTDNNGSVTSDTGSGQPIDITPFSFILPAFVKIVD